METRVETVFLGSIFVEKQVDYIALKNTSIFGPLELLLLNRG